MSDLTPAYGQHFEELVELALDAPAHGDLPVAARLSIGNENEKPYHMDGIACDRLVARLWREAEVVRDYLVRHDESLIAIEDIFEEQFYNEVEALLMKEPDSNNGAGGLHPLANAYYAITSTIGRQRGHKTLHAEGVAILAAQAHFTGYSNLEIGDNIEDIEAGLLAFRQSMGAAVLRVTMEPCTKLCLQTAWKSGIRKVEYLLDRNFFSDIGLVNGHGQTAQEFNQAMRYGMTLTKVSMPELETYMQEQIIDLHPVRNKAASWEDEMGLDFQGMP